MLNIRSVWCRKAPHTAHAPAHRRELGPKRPPRRSGANDHKLSRMVRGCNQVSATTQEPPAEALRLRDDDHGRATVGGLRWWLITGAGLRAWHADRGQDGGRSPASNGPSASVMRVNRASANSEGLPGQTLRLRVIARFASCQCVLAVRR